MTIVRSILAVAAGGVASAAVIAGAEMLIHAVMDGDAVFGAVAIGYGLAALTGTWLALKISPVRVAGIVVTVLLAALAASNLFFIMHPVWFAPLAAVLLVIAWWIGDHLAFAERRATDG